MGLDISEEHYKKLQKILGNEGHSFSLEETSKIGNGLIEFFQVLEDSDNNVCSNGDS